MLSAVENHTQTVHIACMHPPRAHTVVLGFELARRHVVLLLLALSLPACLVPLLLAGIEWVFSRVFGSSMNAMAKASAVLLCLLLNAANGVLLLVCRGSSCVCLGPEGRKKQL